MDALIGHLKSAVLGGNSDASDGSVSSKDNATSLETIIQLLKATQESDFVPGGEVDVEIASSGSQPNLIGKEDLDLSSAKVQASIAVGGRNTTELELGKEAFFLDEAVLDVVDGEWVDGVPESELQRFGFIADEDLNEEGKEQSKERDEEDEDGGDESGGRSRRSGNCNNSNGLKWRRRYRARRRAYLSNDPWIQRHAYWRPVGKAFSKYGYSPVACRVVSKILTLFLDHGTISNTNGCCCKTESLFERLSQYISDTLATSRAATFQLNFLLRILAAPVEPESSDTEIIFTLGRVWKRIMCAPIDNAAYSRSVPSPAALVSELNELLIYLQKNMGLPAGTILGLMFEILVGTSRIGAPGTVMPTYKAGTNSYIIPFSKFNRQICCNGPCGCYDLGITERLAPVWKFWMVTEIVPDKCLDRLCGRIRLLLIQLLELCPINKCKLRAYKYRDCCGNVRTLCAPKAPDIVSVLLQIILCDSDLFVEGVGPINILGNELLCFVFGIIKRLITYAPPPRLGCVWKGPCQAKKCTSDPVCGRGCENDDCARSSPAGTCERDPFNPFGTFAYWNCRKRKEFEENQKKENEATIAEEEGGRKREAESFENVAGRLRAAIELQNKEQEKEDEEKEKETEDEEDSSGARIRRKAPLPSRPVKDALPRIKVPLPAPRGVSLDEMPLEPDMKDLVKYVEIFKNALTDLGVFRDRTVVAVFSAIFNSMKQLDQVVKNGPVNPDRKALADCTSNPFATQGLQLLQQLTPVFHTLFCIPEVRALDFVVQPLKQLIVEIIDSNPCGQAMPASQCENIYNIFEVVFFGILAG